MSRRSILLLTMAVVWVVMCLLYTKTIKAVEPPAQCVRVFVMDKDGTHSAGSASYIGPKLVVTCNHVVKDRGSDKATVVFPDWQVITGKVVKVDAKQDLALVKLDKAPDGVRPLPMSIQDSWKETDLFTVFGYGNGIPKKASGRLSRTRYQQGYREVAGVPSRSGDSGGTILDAAGRFAGTLWGSDREATMFTPVSIVIKFAGVVTTPTPYILEEHGL